MAIQVQKAKQGKIKLTEVRNPIDFPSLPHTMYAHNKFDEVKLTEFAQRHEAHEVWYFIQHNGAVLASCMDNRKI